MAQPGSWLGDAVEEYKGLPTWGKILVGVAVVGVAVFAYIQWKNKASTTSSTPSTSTTGSSDTTGSSGTPYYPNVSSNGTNVPALPSNVNPLYSPTGTLEGYQTQAPAATPVTNPTSTTQPSQTTTTTTQPVTTPPVTTTPTGIGNDTARDAAILAAQRTYWQPSQKSQLDAAIAAAKAQYPRSGPTGDGGISFGAMITHRPEVEPHNSGTPFFPVYPRLMRNE
jgi:hypothetical protein